jgi:hypothetical protein
MKFCITIICFSLLIWHFILKLMLKFFTV